MLVRGRAGPYICMVMELLGTSLVNHVQKHGQKFKVPIACLVRSSCLVELSTYTPRAFYIGKSNPGTSCLQLLMKIMALSEFLISIFPQAMQADMQVMADLLVGYTLWSFWLAAL